MAAGKQVKSWTKRGRFWLEHLQRWRRSGLSQSQYCRQRRLSVAAFRWWKGQWRDASTRVRSPRTRRTRHAKKGSFIELTAGVGVATSAAVVYEIVLPNRRCVRVAGGFDPERVRQLLEALETSC